MPINQVMIKRLSSNSQSSIRLENCPSLSSAGGMWLKEKEWRRVQQSLPIACVDVVPFQSTSSEMCDVGCILRDAPHEGRKWCLIGGRLLRNETLANAVERQLRITLGDKIRFSLDIDEQPLYVGQYFPEPKTVGGVDPRQHAVSLIFAVEISGEVVPADEAHDFAWYPIDALPSETDVGFSQYPILRESVRRLKARLDADKIEGTL